MLADNAAPMLAAWDSDSSASAEPSRGTRTVRTEDSGDAGPVTVARTMSMGLRMVCSTLSVTLPSTQRAMPPLPWVDITTNAVGSVLAWVTMASAGVPRNIDTETLWPSASNRSPDRRQNGLGSLLCARHHLVDDTLGLDPEHSRGQDVEGLHQFDGDRQRFGDELGVGQSLFGKFRPVQGKDYFGVHGSCILRLLDVGAAGGRGWLW